MEQYAEVCRAHAAASEAGQRGAWERVRTLASVLIQPHASKRITPGDVLRFPWDKDTQDQPRAMTHAERMERAREALRRLT